MVYNRKTNLFEQRIRSDFLIELDIDLFEVDRHVLESYKCNIVPVKQTIFPGARASLFPVVFPNFSLIPSFHFLSVEYRASQHVRRPETLLHDFIPRYRQNEQWIVTVVRAQ